MWHRMAASCLLLVAFHVTVLEAEEKSETTLFAASGWARLQLVLGRVAVSTIRSSQSRSVAATDPAKQLEEKLFLSSDTEIPSLRYQRVTPADTLSVELVNGQRLTIVRQPTADTDLPPLRFTQTPGAPCVLVLGDGPQARTHRADSVWHLMLEAPTDFHDQLAPILESLQPSWRFHELSARAQDELIRLAQHNRFDTHRTAELLIARLGSSNFSEREMADRELRELGLRALPILERVDRLALNREQQQRLARIQADLRMDAADSPERIAAWLVEDTEVWVAMLRNDELPVREYAAAHLSKRFKQVEQFDPAAGPEQRQAQVALLERQLQRR